MSLFEKTYHYFRELSAIPRRPHHEEKVRQWLIVWAQSHNWKYEEDTVGNLLIVAETSTLTNSNPHPSPPPKGEGEAQGNRNTFPPLRGGLGGGLSLQEEETQLNIPHCTLNIHDSIVCLQSHMDMVCVSDHEHDFSEL